MGNSLDCFYPKEAMRKASGSSRFSPPPAASAARETNSWLPRPASTKKKNKKEERELVAVEDEEDALVREQAIAAVMLLKQYQRDNDSLSLFSRSASTSALYPSMPRKSNSQQSFARSSTSRQRSHSGAPLAPLQRIDPEDIGVSDDASLNKSKMRNEASGAVGAETKHFVLVHGGGYGAWCWYKTITLLREAGFRVDAVDLGGSGIQSGSANKIKSMAEYVKPLIEMLDKLGLEEQVILVGHDFGGACISYAMELHPTKIAKAVFVAATMLKHGQSVIDLLSQQGGLGEQMRQAQIFQYGNGDDQPPTAIDLDEGFLPDLLFNLSPAKDVALASVSMRPIPFMPILEKLALSDQNYGSVRRFYIRTQEDNAIPGYLQEAMIHSNPPEKVFFLKGSDHSPFFSKAQALHRHLLEIAKMPSE